MTADAQLSLYDDTEAQILDFHRSMVVDGARMRAYARAIMAAVEPGDVVLDIGSGTGVLAFFACIAGARRVYAVERGPVIDLARELSERNGFGARVEFLNEWSTAVQLPEPVDVLVTETIGNAAIDEGILGWATDARTRLLRPGGKVVPGRLGLWTALVETWDDHELVSDWGRQLFTLDFTAARKRATETLWWVELLPRHIVSEPALVADIDLTAVTEPEVVGRGVVEVRRDAFVHGLACWFDAEVGPGVTVSNAPPAEAPSWSQAFLPAAKPFGASAGEAVAWEVRASANGEHWQWSVEPTNAAPSPGSPRRTAASPVPPGHPRCSARGEVDLTILQLMDGAHTVTEIVDVIVERFPYHFVDRHDVQEHVIVTVDDYRRTTPDTTDHPRDRKD